MHALDLFSVLYVENIVHRPVYCGFDMASCCSSLQMWLQLFHPQTRGKPENTPDNTQVRIYSVHIDR